MIFDGKKLAREILAEIKKETIGWKTKPTMAVVSLGEKSDNSSYIKQKKETALELGFGFKHFHFDPPVTTSGLSAELNKLAKRKDINGMVIQLPLPDHIKLSVFNIIPPEKDVDLLSDRAAGSFFNGRSLIDPPTPAAIIHILEKSNIDIRGKTIAVFGFGRLVGRFLTPMLVRVGAIVIIIEKNTPPNLVMEFSLKSDIIISAVGRSETIKADMVKEGAVVVDAGFSLVDNNIVGDVDFNLVKDKASLITPVPGGVGPVTVALLFKNIVKLYENNR
ncbi:MAG: bifunctional 5,10-methylenetetrahydrofolate dehydrogenase/5,10-methenyltetrahydrofolate cyclohydrolase [Patescibacteria group bacterium]